VICSRPLHHTVQYLTRGNNDVLRLMRSNNNYKVESQVSTRNANNESENKVGFRSYSLVAGGCLTSRWPPQEQAWAFGGQTNTVQLKRSRKQLYINPINCLLVKRISTTQLCERTLVIRAWRLCQGPTSIHTAMPLP
jgi:hypothetical protein